MHGFGAQGPPRPGAKNPVKYPFKSFDGAVTIDKEKSGERTWDINTDGVAHYGLYPDWIQDLRMQAGNEIVDDMSKGAEAYLQMWERAQGVAAPTDRSPSTKMTRSGIGGVQLGKTYRHTLIGAAQPMKRDGRVWTWHVKDKGSWTAVLTPKG